MARPSFVVPRTHRREIVLALLSATLALALWLLPAAPGAFPRYSASAPDTDLAVVGGIRKADARPAPTAARAVILPHHLAAAEAIALGVRTLASSSPTVVVVLSPDHFGKCPTLLCTSRGSYQTFFGRVPIESWSVAWLLSHRGLVTESTLFDGEHGIAAIVPFVRHYLPGAEVVPLAVSQKGRGNERMRAEALGAIDSLVARGAALIVSTDFSHYLPLAEAGREDALTKESLCHGAADEILSLDNPSQSDCPLCLWFAREEAERRGFWNLSFLWHSNSAELLGDASARETTSHFVIALGNAPATIGACREP